MNDWDDNDLFQWIAILIIAAMATFFLVAQPQVGPYFP